MASTPGCVPRHLEHHIGALVAGALGDGRGEVRFHRIDGVEAKLPGNRQTVRIDLGNHHPGAGIARHHGDKNADRAAADDQRVLARL